MSTSQPVVDVRSAELAPLGPWPPGIEPYSGTPLAFGLELSDDGHVQTGIWECTPGSFPSRRDGICELMHFVAGDATIIDDDGTRHEIRAAWCASSRTVGLADGRFATPSARRTPSSERPQ